MRISSSAFFLSILLLLCPASAAGASLEGAPTEIEVTDGESLHAILRQVREWRRTGDERCRHGVIITVRAGRYYMSEPLFLRPEDSGTAAAPTIIRGEEGTVIYGDPRQRHVQLWPRQGMERMLGFDTANGTIAIPSPPQQLTLPSASGRRGMQYRGDGHREPFGDGLEMVVCQRWAMAILRVKDMEQRGDSTIVTFMEPESRLEFDHPWPQPVIGGEKGSSAFMLRTTELRDGVEQLVVVGGTEEQPVSHIRFENITFEKTCWNRPLHRGHVTLQGGMPLVDAYKLKENEGLPWDAGLENQAWVERPVAAVSVSHASQVSFHGCTFRQMGATALDFIDDTDSCAVTDCTFTDIGGSAIMAGSFAESPREVHRPYEDLAKRSRHLVVRGNTISHAAVEDWGAVAIGCGYVCDTEISHNTIDHVNYCGICVGWGWTAKETGMERNHIHHNRVTGYALQLYDAGGIYTLSNQPASTISDNVIGAPGPAPYATNDRAFRIYLDARTDGYTLRANATEQGQPLGRSDIGDNQPGPNVVIENME